jgi:D-alanyl-D-alanine carboxypeptidase
MRALIIVFLSAFAVLRHDPAAAGPALVFDAKSSRVLYAEDPDMLWHPASLTKLMTAYLTFAALKAGKITPKSQVEVSRNAFRQPPSKVGLPIGGQMSAELAIDVLIVKSANDVAVMLAEKIAGSEDNFVALMNKTAKRLGMSNTRFYNANGLPDARQVTTARDLALLARAILKDFPEYADEFKQQYVKIGKRRLRSHNDLLRTFEGADGMKTGFICASGFNVVASATRDDRKLVAVVLGAPSLFKRRERASNLLAHNFETFTWKALFSGPDIETLPRDGSEAKGPVNMRDAVATCNRKARKHRKKRSSKKKRSLKKKTKVKKKPKKS